MGIRRSSHRRRRGRDCLGIITGSEMKNKFDGLLIGFAIVAAAVLIWFILFYR
jgi:hypothetical protein